ncbi:hypothetical protein CYMTET_45976 [Cymbomonas tetramitiformis]|uniref:Uncharacterized protein n=1 Tax=Cymbomonas tetramitiformis TaxID=36881 RepID=A0AAE0BX42_9CHLO|nr:hypothetical protein CYMTET_45976 [Cymbomonas tetramitiformis]
MSWVIVLWVILPSCIPEKYAAEAVCLRGEGNCDVRAWFIKETDARGFAATYVASTLSPTPPPTAPRVDPKFTWGYLYSPPPPSTPPAQPPRPVAPPPWSPRGFTANGTNWFHASFQDVLDLALADLGETNITAFEANYPNVTDGYDRYERAFRLYFQLSGTWSAHSDLQVPAKIFWTANEPLAPPPRAPPPIYVSPPLPPPSKPWYLTPQRWSPSSPPNTPPIASEVFAWNPPPTLDFNGCKRSSGCIRPASLARFLQHKWILGRQWIADDEAHCQQKCAQPVWQCERSCQQDRQCITEAFYSINVSALPAGLRTEALHWQPPPAPLASWPNVSAELLFPSDRVHVFKQCAEGCNAECTWRDLARECEKECTVRRKEILYGRFFDAGKAHSTQQPRRSILADLLVYVLTRPRDAIPAEVRQLLLPEGVPDSRWPGSLLPRSMLTPPPGRGNRRFYKEKDVKPYLPERSGCDARCRVHALIEAGLPELLADVHSDGLLETPDAHAIAEERFRKEMLEMAKPFAVYSAVAAITILMTYKAFRMASEGRHGRFPQFEYSTRDLRMLSASVGRGRDEGQAPNRALRDVWDSYTARTHI